MEPRRLLEELLALANALGIEVRSEPVRRARSAGGLCRVRGRDVALLDEGAPVVDRARALAEALAELPRVDAMHVSPAVRVAIETARDRRAWRAREPLPSRRNAKVRPLPLKKPGVKSCR